jgi:hypothetical protein
VRGDDACLARKRLLRRDGDAIGEIGEILVVGDLVEVDEAAEPRCELLVVLQASA